MRIVEVHEKTVSIASPIANAFIDFSKMTCSVVALVTDVIRDGERVVGYGFNSNGRYGQGALMRERFFPRLMAADPKTLLDTSSDNLDPFKIWSTLMANEKPGGHGERSVAVGTIDMAVWDAVAKIAGRPLHRLLADKFQRLPNPRLGRRHRRQRRRPHEHAILRRAIGARAEEHPVGQVRLRPRGRNQDPRSDDDPQPSRPSMGSIA